MKNKTLAPVVAAELPEVVTIETLLRDYSKLPTVQRMNLGRMIQAEAVNQLRSEKTALETKLAEIAGLIGEPEPVRATRTVTASSGDGVGGKIVAAIKTGPKTVKELQAATGTKWLNVALSKLQSDKVIVSDGKRPATYSLK